MDENKSHDDNNGGGQREKIETYVADKKVMICSVTNKSVKRVCYSLKSHAKTLLEVSGREENEEEETCERKVGNE